MTTELQEQDLPAVVNLDRPMSVNEVLTQSMIVHEILTRVMVNDIHYGTLPGCKKPSLYQPGAEKICVTFRLAPKFDVEDLSEPRENFYRYRVKCSLYTIRDGLFVGSAMGEASTAEEKYQWEAALNQRHFDATEPDKRRIKFKRTKDGEVEEIQQVQQNAADLANTVLKMACKRALTSVTKGATGASDIFDVDLEEDAVAKLAKEETKEAPKMKAKAAPAPKLNFGRSKGKHIDDPTVPVKDLKWMLENIESGLGSPDRKKWEASDKKMIAALQHEIEKRAKPAEPKGDVRGPIGDEEWMNCIAVFQGDYLAEYERACTELKVEGEKVPQGQRWAFYDLVQKFIAEAK